VELGDGVLAVADRGKAVRHHVGILALPKGGSRYGARP
jgi:hypothetical protein